MSGPVLQVSDLSVTFSAAGGHVTPVNGVGFGVARGEAVALVGESGCGKSVTADTVLRLHDETSTRYRGHVRFEGRDVLDMSKRELRRLRGPGAAMVFQDPMTSLNPVFTVGQQLVETIRLHRAMTRAAARTEAQSLLSRCGISDVARRIGQYPHELSGGLRQRVMIAMALASRPRLLVADEPTTALDVTTQKQILDLLDDLRTTEELAVLLITHDLGVVAQLCDRVVVMYLGQAVEQGTVRDVFTRPCHPYTAGLLASRPDAVADNGRALHVIPGQVPPITAVPAGCRFRSRCSLAQQQCETAPELEKTPGGTEVRCWRWRDIASREENGDDHTDR